MSNHNLFNASTKELYTLYRVYLQYCFSVSCTALTTVRIIQLLYLQNSAKRKSAEQYRCQSRTYSSHNGKLFSV